MPKPSWPAGDLFAPGAPHETMRSPQAPSWPPGALGESLLLRFDIKLFFILGWSPNGSLRLSKFMCDTKPKEVLCCCWVLAPMQFFNPRISSAMAMAMSIYSRLTQNFFFLISASSFGTEFRMGKTRPCEFFQIYRPILSLIHI